MPVEIHTFLVAEYAKKKGCKPQPAPIERSLFSVFELVGVYSYAGVKLRHDHKTSIKRRGFRCLQIEPIASSPEVLQIRVARSCSLCKGGLAYPSWAVDWKRPEGYPRLRGTIIVGTVAIPPGVVEYACAPMEICDRSAR